MKNISKRNKILRLLIVILLCIIEYYTPHDPNVVYGTFAIGTAALILGGVALAAGVTTSSIAASNAKNAEKAAASEADRLQGQLDTLEASRPEYKNPYEKLTNQFANLNNPYANMTVATEAAEIQAEQADIALANSLDIMMEQGMGAGGATALAQAALQSKRGIAASIQAQESQNKRMAAEGEANVAKMRAEGAAAVDKLKAQGDAAAQSDAINWHMQKLDRVASQLDNEKQNEVDAKAAKNAAIVGIGNAVISGASVASGGIGQGKS